MTSQTPLQSAPAYGLRPSTRYVTSHDETGKSVFSPSPPLQYLDRGRGYAISRTYAISEFPAPLVGDKDLNAYLSDDGKKNPSSYTNVGSVVVPGGVNVVTMDMGPGARSMMHRTISVDFIVVVEGEIELELDGGEKVVLRSGDTVVQRSTMHRWTNLSQDKPARFVGVTVSGERIELGGKPIEQEYLQDKEEEA